MKFNSRSLHLRNALLAGTIISGLAFAAPAMAQDATTGDNTTSAEETVVVTGSRIKSKNLVSSSPVTVVGAAEIAASGATRVEDMVNNLPQVFAADGAFYSNGASGTATVNLRGLGTARTLVLINGYRMQPGSPILTAPDINQIPAALIDRVEVLSGGASAVYGSDALAGVVNFIMKKNFQGVQLDVNHSFYQHHNDSSFGDLVRDSGYDTPKSNVIDGEQTDVTLTAGSDFAEGKGNATAYLSYRTINKVLQSERDYSACAASYDYDDTPVYCGGSSTTFPGRFFATNAANPKGKNYSIDYDKGVRDWSSSDVFNYGPTNYFQRPDEKYAGGFFVNYEINPAAKVRMEAMLNDDHSTGQIAASGIFYGAWQLNCDNPLLASSVTGAMGCSAADIADGTLKDVRIGRRFVETGGRQYDMRHTAYTFRTGIGGDIFDIFNYDINAQYGTVNYKQVNQQQFINTRLQDALLVVKDDAGNLVCKEASLAGCSPLDIWTGNGISSDAMNYVSAVGVSWGSVTQQVITGTFGGDLTSWGVKTPWANEGVMFNIGTEYRRETLDFDADDNMRYGLLAGAGGVTSPLKGAYNVMELFGEVALPLVSDKTFAKDLTLELGARTSSYSNSGRVNSWKASLAWKPIDDLLIRIGQQRAVRGANITELFTATTVQLTDYTDPCAVTKPGVDKPTASAAACALTGVSAADYGYIEANTAGQYNYLDGGNQELKPEKGDTTTVGFVYTPSYLKGLSISVDYFNIDITDRIGTIGVTTILDNCMKTGEDFYCSKVHRDKDGSLWLSDDGYVANTNYNTGGLRTKGVDVQVNYAHNLPSNLGRMSYNYVGTFVDELSTKATPDADWDNCAGYYDADCGYPNPQYRHKFIAKWSTPWNADISATWRHYGEVKDFYGETPEDSQLAKIGAQDYIDLYASVDVTKNATFHIGVNNVFDKDPPIMVADDTNGNTYPQTYDPLGRYVFMGVKLKY